MLFTNAMVCPACRRTIAPTQGENTFIKKLNRHYHMIQRIIFLLLSLLLFPKGNIPIAIHYETTLSQPKANGLIINIVIPDLFLADAPEWKYIPVASPESRLTAYRSTTNRPKGIHTTKIHTKITKRRPFPPMAWTRTRHRKWPLKNIAGYCRNIEREDNANESSYALIRVEVWIVQLNKKEKHCKRQRRKHPHPWRENGLNNIHHNHPITGLSIKV
jgi:hypothetical protein